LNLQSPVPYPVSRFSRHCCHAQDGIDRGYLLLYKDARVLPAIVQAGAEIEQLEITICDFKIGDSGGAD
jgi:hypothetical protein